MSYHLTTKYGGTEAVIDDNCGISKFYLIADALTNRLHVTFLNQVDDAETLDWDFQYKNYFLTLHYNIFNGVSILPHTIKGVEKENDAVLEVAKFLKRNGILILPCFNVGDAILTAKHLLLPRFTSSYL